jgi:hypothetical protein
VPVLAWNNACHDGVEVDESKAVKALYYLSSAVAT